MLCRKDGFHGVDWLEQCVKVDWGQEQRRQLALVPGDLWGGGGPDLIRWECERISASHWTFISLALNRG